MVRPFSNFDRTTSVLITEDEIRSPKYSATHIFAWFHFGRNGNIVPGRLTTVDDGWCFTLAVVFVVESCSQMHGFKGLEVRTI